MAATTEGPRTLSDLLDRTQERRVGGPATRLDDGSSLVVVRHSSWLVGFRLVKIAGVWQMTEMAARYLRQGATSVAGLRALPLGELLAEARRLAGQGATEEKAPRPAGKLTRPGEIHLRPFLADERKRGTRRPKSDYAWLAYEYVALLERGITTPAKHIAETYGGGSAALWANRISKARDLELLTKEGTTTAGGELTDLAWELLGLAEFDDDETDRHIAAREGRADP